MKKKILILVPFLLAMFCSFGQAPGIFNYQGVARNSVGNVLANQSIALRLTIHDGAPAGPIVYQEIRSLITNPFGLFNVQVGSPGATGVVGTISGINYAVGSKHIQVEIDPNGGSSFINIGTAQLASVPYALHANASSDIVLPINKTQSDPGMLITITNSGNGASSGAFSGLTNSTAANVSALVGTVSSASPGGFSAGVRGINNGTGGLGIGVYGSQAGSGWGVYGTAVSGIGVNGLSTSGFGVYGSSTSGVGVYGFSTTGFAGRFENSNVANTSDALIATTNGSGHAVSGMNTGTGRGGNFIVNNAASTADALRAETNGTGASWAFRGISTGTNGAGLFVQSNATNTANNLQSNQAGLGRAGLFNSTNVASTANAVDINVAGTGYALQLSSTNALPKALRTVGGLQLTGINEAANRVLTTDALGNATWQTPGGAGLLVLPLDQTQAETGFLFRLTNSGTTSTSSAIEGVTNSTAANVYAIRGTVSSTSPGGFSSALRGLNNGTGGLGIGVWGSHGGSGWGVYGVTPNGLGVYGNSTAGGYGIFGNSASGTGVYGTSTDGFPGQFSITNNTNNNPALQASTLSDGDALNATTSSTTASVAAVRGVVSSTSPGGFSAAVRGQNNGTGGLGVGMWGSQNGSGWGVYGVTPTGLGVYGNSTGSGYGVFANSTSGIGLYSTSTDGQAANFTITNNTNASAVVTANSLGNGTIISVSSAGFGKGVFSSTGPGFALHGVTTSIASAGLVGDNTGGGEAVVGRNNSNVAGAVVGRNDGGGYGVRGFIGNDITGTAVGVLGQIGIGGSNGRAGRFENVNQTNTFNAFEVETVGNGNIPDRTLGNAANFRVNNTNSVAGAVRGEVNTIFGNFGAAAIFGESRGTGGFAGLFYAQNPAGNGPALVALADGNGNAITANASNSGDGVETSVDGTGNALFAWTPTFSTGSAARLVNFNNVNLNPVLTVEQHSAGTLALFKAGDPATANVVRISATGQIFANGGFILGGADLAEAFHVDRAIATYEPGDVMIISTTNDRSVDKSNSAYSTLVVGVYATKPGVLLAEGEVVDTDLSDRIPLGVVGVLPTKVCTEGGAIKRGDMLVTSSIPGVAMKADPDKVKTGQVIGKALQDYDGTGISKIKVMVSIK